MTARADSVPRLARPLAPFDTLDRYELLARYAAGGMATVWLARLEGKHGFEKLVAVKTILPELASDPAFRSMLLDEARIAARIRHPNVAEIDDLGEERGTPYLVFEWIDGDSLATLYQAVAQSGEAFPQDLLLRIVADACLGLHAAHTLRDEHGVPLSVVHRDVSPQNLMISHTGVTKVIDFGVARARDRLSPKTKTGLMKGKIEYAAPEQATLGQIDARTDVFSAGVILFQLLTGKLPYPGPNGKPLLAAVARATEAPRLPSFIPHSVAEVVRRAIAPRPEDRYQSALDLSNALSGVMAHPFSASDVAAFLGTHLSKRIEERRTLIAEARQLAAMRRASGAARPSGSLPVPPGLHVAAPSHAATRPDAIGVPPVAAAAPIATPVVRPVHKALMGVGGAAAVLAWAVVAVVGLRGGASSAPSSPAPDTPAAATSSPPGAASAPASAPPTAPPPASTSAAPAAPPTTTSDPPRVVGKGAAAPPPPAAPPTKAPPPATATTTTKKKRPVNDGF